MAEKRPLVNASGTIKELPTTDILSALLIDPSYDTTATAAGTTTLTVNSKINQYFTGTLAQTVVLPDATTLVVGWKRRIVDKSTGSLTINKNGGSLLKTVTAGNEAIVVCTDITTAAGTWDVIYSNDLSIGDATASSLSATGLIKSSSPSAGMGYSTGAGGTVTQGTSKATGVTMSPNPCVCGAITTHNASLAAAAEVKFTVTNSAVAATDVVVVCIKSGGTSGSYGVWVSAVGSGSFDITLSNLSGGALVEAVVINFVVIKAVTS